MGNIKNSGTYPTTNYILHKFIYYLFIFIYSYIIYSYIIKSYIILIKKNSANETHIFLLILLEIYSTKTLLNEIKSLGN